MSVWLYCWDDMSVFVCVDGLQRVTACEKFLDNEIPIFDTLCKDFSGKMPMDVDLLFHVNDLKTCKEVLMWYYEMNSYSTPHTKEELDRVKKMIEQEQ